MAQATAAVLGGFWPTNGVSSLTQIARGFARRRVAQLLATKSNMALREVMETLDGVAAGQAASKVLTRVANSTDLSGKRTVETETIISRNTTAADVTAINADILTLSTRSYTASPIANKDLNPLGYR